jgi:integrase
MATPNDETVHGGFFSVEPMSDDGPEMELQVGRGSRSGYVLAHETGDAFTIKQLRRRAYQLMELLGLRRVRLYDARSSCFTFRANNGVPDHILARWAGHTNVKTTKRWYVKPDVEDLRGVATTWDGLHGGAAEGQE